MNTLKLLYSPAAAIRENMEAMRSVRDKDTERALDPKVTRAKELYGICHTTRLEEDTSRRRRLQILVAYCTTENESERDTWISVCGGE